MIFDAVQAEMLKSEMYFTWFFFITIPCRISRESYIFLILFHFPLYFVTQSQKINSLTEMNTLNALYSTKHVTKKCCKPILKRNANIVSTLQRRRVLTRQELKAKTSTLVINKGTTIDNSNNRGIIHLGLLSYMFKLSKKRKLIL